MRGECERGGTGEGGSVRGEGQVRVGVGGRDGVRGEGGSVRGRTDSLH